MIEDELTSELPAQPRRAMTGGIVIAAGSRVSVAITGAATTIAIARLLGPAGAGTFAVAQSVIIISTTLATLGLDHGILYYVSSGAWEAMGAHRASQRLAFSVGLVAGAVVVLIRLAVPSLLRGLSISTTLLLAAAVPFALSWLYTSIIALGTDDYEGYVLPPAVQSACSLALAAGLAAWRGIVGGIAGLAIAHVATALLALIRRRGRENRRATDRARASKAPIGPRNKLRPALRFGLKGYAANAMQFLNLRLDLLILNGVASVVAVGHYAVAVSVTSVMWLLPWALSDILLPRVAALSADVGDQSTLDAVEIKGLRHNSAITSLLTAILAAALVVLVVPIYGARFSAAVGLGLILLPGAAFLALAAPMTATVTGRGRPDLILIVALIVTPLTIGMYATLIPLLGATGAAVSSTGSYAVTFLVTAIMYRRVTGRSLIVMLPTRSELLDYQLLAGRGATIMTRLRSHT